MSNDDDNTHRNGRAFAISKDGLKVIDLEPHEDGECDQKCEEAVQKAFGHETVYEAEDAPATRSSVGYSRTYAAGYDAAFGKN